MIEVVIISDQELLCDFVYDGAGVEFFLGGLGERVEEAFALVAKVL